MGKWLLAGGYTGMKTEEEVCFTQEGVCMCS